MSKENKKHQYIISYTTADGMVVLNSVCQAKNRQEAIEDVKADSDAVIILSVVEIRAHKKD